MTNPIRLTDVSFSYRRAEAAALRNVSFSVEKGCITAISGRTGAGKTTCSRTLNGLIPYVIRGEWSGQIQIGGELLDDRNRINAIRKVGMVFQDFEAQLFSTTVRGEVAFTLENHGISRDEMITRIDAALRQVGLIEQAEQEPSSLSGGQKQRLAIACLLALSPDILVLDEPTTDLDPVGKTEVLSLLHEMADCEQTIILIEHDTQLLRRANRLVLMDSGQITHDAYSDFLLGETDILLQHGIRPPFQHLLWKKLGIANSPLISTSISEQLRLAGYRVNRDLIPPKSVHCGSSLIKVENLHFAYPGKPNTLHGINLEIHQGEAVSILGANGSGKTTLVQHFNGIRKPQSGRVLVSEVETRRQTIGKLAEKIGFVFQNPDHQLFNSTVYNEIEYGLRVRKVPQKEWPERIENALDAVRLLGMNDRDPFAMTKGERQKLALATVLALEPEAIILDEPTTGLDALEQRVMIRLLRHLRQQGHTIIIITHSMETALACTDRAIILDSGTILADGPIYEVFADETLLQKAKLQLPEEAFFTRQLGLGILGFDDLLNCMERMPL